MYIEKVDYDYEYPYRIGNNDGEQVGCTKNDLIELKREIDRLLNEPHQVQTRVPSYGSVGGQMVQKMIACYKVGAGKW